MDNDELLAKAKEHWESCKTYYDQQYIDSEEDWLFLHGKNQWDDNARRERERDGRVCLTLNQLLPYADQVTNDIKQARLAINVIPVDDKSDPKTAEIRAGIIRNVEKQSRAKSVYGTAALNAIGAGIGWIQIDHDYIDGTFEQEAKLKRILDFKSCMLDPQSEEIDGSDAMYGFKRIDYTKERFEELYPDSPSVSFDGESGENVCIVRYYYKKLTKKTICQIKLIDGSIEVVPKDMLDTLEENNVTYELLAERKYDSYAIYSCLLSGSDVLAEPEEFPSQYIPIIPVYGREVFLDGKREAHSLIRQAKPAQQMYNYWNTTNVEMVALQPKTPWVAPVGSFDSYPDQWETANTLNHAVLEYDPVQDKNGQLLPPPQRQPQVSSNPSLIQGGMSAKEDIRLGLGMPQSNMGERSNAISGKAIGKQQIEGDNATYHFIDNLVASIAQAGRILNEMIPALYSEKQVQRIIGENGDEERVVVNVPYVRDESGYRAARPNEQAHGIFDLSSGKYDIDMDVGASYSSKRQEAADKMTDIVQARPDFMDIAGDLYFEALDMPMSRQIADRIKTRMPPEMLGDDPQAARLQQMTQALDEMQKKVEMYDAALKDKEKNTQFEQSIELRKIQLDQQKLALEAQKTMAEIKKIEAETKGENVEAMSALGNAIQAINERVHDMGATLEVILDAKEREVGATEEPYESSEESMEDENGNS